MDNDCQYVGDPAVDCPSDAVLAALAAGNLSERQQLEIEGLLNRCSRCRERLDVLLGDVVPDKFQVSSTAQMDVELGDADTVPIADCKRPLPHQIGPYRVIQSLGEGGFGIVYQAEQRAPVQRVVALKVLKAGMDSREVLARFEAERQALALMDHPNIAHVLDAGQTERSRPYFAMEMVRGMPITDYCDRQKLGLTDRINLFIQVCHAVQHAHQKGVIHRDLKPSNVMVTLVDGQAVPKIIDFGIAKAISQPLTEQTLFTSQGQLIGTPEYMSPEQAEMSGLDVDTRTDIYSLGVLLYELLTGTLPFDTKVLRAAGYSRIQRLIREQDPPKPSTRLSTLAEQGKEQARSRNTNPLTLSRQISGDLDWITLKCLEKNRTRRYETANGLAQELKRYLNDEPVLAGPPSLRYRAKKFVRKHRMAVTAASMVLVALVLGLLGTSYGMLWAIQAQNKASQQKVQADAAREEAELARDQEELASEEAERRTAEAEWRSYLANIAAAQSALEDNRPVAEIRRHLDACPEHLRNWEWKWLSAESRYAVAVLQGHTGPVFSARFSPDGEHIVTASGDETARVWDAASGAEEFRLEEHAGPVHTASFSPDGKWIVTSSGDGTARIWNAKSGERVDVLSHEGAVNSAAFSRDGTQIVTASNDGTVRIWNRRTGEVITKWDDFAGPAIAASFSPDGTRIVTASDGGNVDVLDAKTGRQIAVVMTLSNRTNAVAFSPDGTRIVTALSEGTADVYDAATGDFIGSVGQHFGPVRSASYSPDGAMIVTASNDGTAQMWDAKTGEYVTTLEGHLRGVTCASFSPDGKQIVTASDDGTARRIWNAEIGITKLISRGTAVRMPADMHGPLGRPPGVEAGGRPPPMQNRDEQAFWGPHPGPPPRRGGPSAFSPDGTKVIVGSRDGIARIWNLQTGEVPVVLEGYRGPISAFAFSPDSTRVVSGSIDSTARLWDAETGNLIDIMEGDSGAVSCVAFSPDGTQIAVASGETVRIYDSDSREQKVVLERHSDEIRDIVFSSDNKRIVTTSLDSTARVWELPSGNQVFVLEEHSGPVMDAAFSPDSSHIRSQILTCSRDNTARLWDATTGEPLYVIGGHSGWINTVQFSSEGRRIVTASNDGTARVTLTESGREVAVLRGHSAGVRTAAFSPDGTRVVTASEDGTARVWDTDTGDEVTRLAGHSEWVVSAEFSPDGTRITTVTESGAIRVWGNQPWDARRRRWHNVHQSGF